MDQKMILRRRLGSTGIEISPLGLGTLKFGRNEQVRFPAGFVVPDEDALAEILAVAKGVGINTLDTAPSYGTSEERLGRLLAGQRRDWILISKAGEEFESGVSRYVFTPDHFARSLDRSLRRLKTDHLDVLLVHCDGDDAQILRDDALMKTLQGFKSQGLVRAVGASTKTLAGGIEAVELLDVVMVHYSPAHTEEAAVVDLAAQRGKGVLLKKLLDSGHLDHIGGEDPVLKAMTFAFANPGVSGVIVGTIDPHHLVADAEAAYKALSARDPKGIKQHQTAS
jgi:aryl-alcohol dehydrogenase-like predicted oxidoreductase